MEGFLWGHQFFLGQNPDPSSGKKPVIEFLGRDQGDEQIADGFCSKGDYREWISLVNDILIYPDVVFLLYASLATPLLPVFGVQNFSLELSNPSSSGKTSALLLVLQLGALQNSIQAHLSTLGTRLLCGSEEQHPFCSFWLHSQHLSSLYLLKNGNGSTQRLNTSAQNDSDNDYDYRQYQQYVNVTAHRV